MTTGTGSAIIRAEAISKTFRPGRGAAVEALRDIDLAIDEGEFVAVVGRSGCGKSTLLRILAGLIPPTEGTVEISGEPVRAPRRDAGLVFQRPALLPWRNVLDNVLLPIEFARRVTQADRNKALELIDLVGLDGFEDSAPRELSGGMQQRAAICRALMLEPTVLLMDEPFGALDALTREELGLEVQRMWSDRRMTIVLVTHSIDEAVLLADRVVVMTPRPGTVARVITVEAPRPRSPREKSGAALSGHSEEIRELLFRKDLTTEPARSTDE